MQSFGFPNLATTLVIKGKISILQDSLGLIAGSVITDKKLLFYCFSTTIGATFLRLRRSKATLEIVEKEF